MLPRKLVVALAVMATLMGGIIIFSLLTKPFAPPTKPAIVQKTAPAKKAVVKPAPAPAVQAPSGSRVNVDVSTPGGSRVKVNVEEGTAVAPPTVLAPAPLPAPLPVPQPAPVPSVQMPAPAPMPVPQVVPPPPVVQPPAAPQAPFQAPSAPDIQAIRSPARTVNVLSGNSIQFRVEIASRWGGTYSGYGSTYGWTPGHEELRYDPRTGTYYRVWVAHPHPGY